MSSSAPRNSYYVPVVIEQDARGERSFDIYSRLLKDRIIFIGTPDEIRTTTNPHVKKFIGN